MASEKEKVGRIHDPEEELEREVWTWEQKGLTELQPVIYSLNYSLRSDFTSPNVIKTC